MAKLSSFQRLLKEDVPSEYQPLIEKIGVSVNQFAEQVLNAMNKNITVEDNLNMEYKTLEVSVTDGVPTIITEFKSGLKTRLKGIVVIKAENVTNTGTYPTNQPFISFSENNSLIRIVYVSGLQNGNKYKLTLETRG